MKGEKKEIEGNRKVENQKILMDRSQSVLIPIKKLAFYIKVVQNNAKMLHKNEYEAKLDCLKDARTKKDKQKAWDRKIERQTDRVTTRVCQFLKFLGDEFFRRRILKVNYE